MHKFEEEVIGGSQLLKKLRLTTDFLERHVVPVLRLDDTDNPDFSGSGIIARLDDRFYLITTAHVLDNCDKGIFLLNKGFQESSLESIAIVTGKKPGTTRSEDRTDIGFIRLTESEANYFGVDNFLDLNHIYSPPMEIKSTIFLVLGYPARNQIVNKLERTVETSLTMFMTGHAEEVAYSMTSTNYNSHILLRYNRKTIATENSIGSPPDFHGMSGGGVWPLSVFYEPL